MNRKIAVDVIAAYDRRGKGRADGPFVDHTRNGAYLEIDPRTGYAREISRSAYESSPHPRYDDGLLASSRDSGGDTDDEDAPCPDCGYSPCKSAHGIDCE